MFITSVDVPCASIVNVVDVPPPLPTQKTLKTSSSISTRKKTSGETTVLSSLKTCEESLPGNNEQHSLGKQGVTISITQNLSLELASGIVHNKKNKITISKELLNQLLHGIQTSGEAKLVKSNKPPKSHIVHGNKRIVSTHNQEEANKVTNRVTTKSNRSPR